MKISNFLIIVIILFITTSCSSTKSRITKPLLWNIERLQTVKSEISKNEKMYQRYIQPANNILNKKPISITEKTISISGDIHNFESISTYFWPNPEDPQGPYICKDGIVNPETKLYDEIRLSEFCKRLKFLSIAYYLTRDECYYNSFIKQIKVWYLNKDTKMNPNFEYAQIIPRINNNHGQPHGIISAYVMNDAIEAIRLINSVKTIEKNTLKEIVLWFHQFLNWLNNSNMAQKEALQNNNHGIAIDVLKLNIALFVNDYKTANKITTSFYSTRLKKQIDYQGRQISELKRTKAFMYSIYNLMHIIDFCYIQESIGNFYYRTNHEIIDQAVIFLNQYIGNRQKFPYQEIDNWDRLETWLKDEIARIQKLEQPQKKQTLNIKYKYDFYKSANGLIR